MLCLSHNTLLLLSQSLSPTYLVKPFSICFGRQISATHARPFANQLQTKIPQISQPLCVLQAPQKNISHTSCQSPKVILAPFISDDKRGRVQTAKSPPPSSPPPPATTCKLNKKHLHFRLCRKVGTLLNQIVQLDASFQHAINRLV